MPTQHSSGISMDRFKGEGQGGRGMPDFAPPKLTAEEKIQVAAKSEENHIDQFFSVPAVAWSPVWLPLTIFLISRFVLRRQRRSLRIITPSILTFATFAFCFLVRARWVLRDPFMFFPIPGPNPDAGLPKPDELNRLYHQSVHSICLYCGILFLLGFVPPLVVAVKSKFAGPESNQIQPPS